jgi:TonB family protein
MSGIILALLVAASPFEPPRVLRSPAGEVPYGARAAGIVALEVTVGADGKVGGVRPVKDLAPFTAALSGAVRRWTFQPATDDGAPVPSRILVLGVFRPAMLTSPAPSPPDDAGYDLSPDAPTPVRWSIPGYPPTALGDAAVVVEATVERDGSPGETRVVTSRPGFDDAALAAARKWAFRPAAVGGRPVVSRVAIAFYFRAPH